MEPQEKVRAVFEEVDDILEVNNQEGTHKAKQINKFIVKALQPEVRETAEKSSDKFTECVMDLSTPTYTLFTI